MTFGAVCVLLMPAEAKEPKDGKTALLFVGYPDGSNWLMTDMLRRLGRAYEEENPPVKVRLKPRTGYKEARPAVLNGKAVGMMISEEINKIRAYVTTIQQGRAFGRGYARELKLNRFIPIAVRTIRSEEGEVVASIRFGIATNRITYGLKGFLAFLGTNEAEEALADLVDMRPAKPKDKPTRITEIRKTQGYPWKEPQRLPQPILAY